MSIFEKIRAGLQKFMIGRHGADEFSLALLIGGLIVSVVGSLFGLPALSLLSTAAYVYSLFRMFSRNVEKRYQENAKFVAFWKKTTSECSQFFTRLKNIRKYKYFRCPECKARIRLPRKVGEVTVTCGKCKHQFKQKA